MAAWISFVNEVKLYAHGNGTKTILMLGGASSNSGCPGNFNIFSFLHKDKKNV